MLNSAGAFSLLPPTEETQNYESTRIKTLFAELPMAKLKCAQEEIIKQSWTNHFKHPSWILAVKYS